MGFKFSSAGPHPPTYCATGDIFRFNIKVGRLGFSTSAVHLVLGYKGLRWTIDEHLNWRSFSIHHIMKLQLIRLTTSIRKTVRWGYLPTFQQSYFYRVKTLIFYCQELMETVKSQINNRYILCLQFLFIKMSDTFLLWSLRPIKQFSELKN